MFVQTVLYRYNRFSRIHYKDDPTIMAWELMNEPRCTSDPSGRTIQVSSGFPLHGSELSEKGSFKLNRYHYPRIYNALSIRNGVENSIGEERSILYKGVETSPTLVGDENETFRIRVWKPLPNRRVLKLVRNGPKWTIFASGQLGLLQIVSELDTERCASKDARPPRGVDCEILHRLEKETEPFLIRVWKPLPTRCCYKWYQSQTARTLGLQEGWIVRSYIGWRGERSLPYKGVEASP